MVEVTHVLHSAFFQTHSAPSHPESPAGGDQILHAGHQDSAGRQDHKGGGGCDVTQRQSMKQSAFCLGAKYSLGQPSGNY